MDLTLVLLRVVHVLCGVFWAGALMFAVIFLEPSVRASGPEGAKVMRALIQRHYLTVVPVVGALTILSGLWLMWIVSGGFGVIYMAGHGVTWGTGSNADYYYLLQDAESLDVTDARRTMLEANVNLARRELEAQTALLKLLYAIGNDMGALGR